MKVLVSRLPGDRQGPDIVDALLASEAAGVARGTQEIDRESTSRVIENGNCVLMPYVPTGGVVNVTEATGSYRGKLTGYTITLDMAESEFSATSFLTIEREL